MKLKLELNSPQILQKVQTPRFGMLVSQNWKRLLDPYTPKNTGMLMGVDGNYEIRPFEIEYQMPYASAVYFNARDVEFITTGTGRNPKATDHWDEKAAQAGELNKLYQILNNALRRGL